MELHPLVIRKKKSCKFSMVGAQQALSAKVLSGISEALSLIMLLDSRPDFMVEILLSLARL